VYLLMCTR